MNGESPFERPAFVPEFTHFGAFRGQKLGLTGHRGTLGRILYERLRQAGVSVEAFDGDVKDAQSLHQWFTAHNFTHFFHFAAIVPVTRVDAEPLLAYETNVIGTFNVVKSIVTTQKHCWFFHSSSSHVYCPTAKSEPLTEEAPRAPQNFYGTTKLAAESIAAPLLSRVGVEFCIGRIFSFSHAMQREPYLVPSLAARIATLQHGDTLEVRNPSAVRDIQDAETIIDVILHLSRLRASGILNIGTGVGLSVRDIALAVAKRLGKRIAVAGQDVDAPGSLIANVTKLQKVLAQ